VGSSFVLPAFFISENHYSQDLRSMLSRVVDYAAGWSPGLFSGIYRQLHLTMSRRPDEWRAAFERYVALGLPLNEGVTRFAEFMAADAERAAAAPAGQMHLSVCSWNLHGSMSHGRGSQPDNRLQQQVQILRTALARPAVLCLQEVSAAMLRQLEEQLQYTVLIAELVYAEVEQQQQHNHGQQEEEQRRPQQRSSIPPSCDASASSAASPVRKRAKTHHELPSLSCSSVAERIKSHGVHPAFCSFNVVAVRSELLEQSPARQQFVARVEPSRLLHEYPTRVLEGADRRASHALFRHPHTGRQHSV
jgi:hypothetical protein